MQQLDLSKLFIMLEMAVIQMAISKKLSTAAEHLLFFEISTMRIVPMDTSRILAMNIKKGSVRWEYKVKDSIEFSCKDMNDEENSGLPDAKLNPQYVKS